MTSTLAALRCPPGQPTPDAVWPRRSRAPVSRRPAAGRSTRRRPAGRRRPPSRHGPAAPREADAAAGCRSVRRARRTPRRAVRGPGTGPSIHGKPAARSAVVGRKGRGPGWLRLADGPRSPGRRGPTMTTIERHVVPLHQDPHRRRWRRPAAARAGVGATRRSARALDPRLVGEPPVLEAPGRERTRRGVPGRRPRPTRPRDVRVFPRRQPVPGCAVCGRPTSRPSSDSCSWTGRRWWGGPTAGSSSATTSAPTVRAQSRRSTSSEPRSP